MHYLATTKKNITNKLQIEIDCDDLHELLQCRAIKACQIKCLNKQTKLCMWALLLKSCF